MSAALRLSGRRILLVEERGDDRVEVGRYAPGTGNMVVGHVSSVDQALTTIKTENIDVAVIDVNLNGEKSYPIAEAFSARSVPFVFSTGYDRTTLPECHIDRPMLQMPFKPSALKSALDDILVSERR